MLDYRLPLYKLHFSSRNKPAAIIDQILSIAQQRNIEVAYHQPLTLSRISKNAKQDQGVALDVKIPTLNHLQHWLDKNIKANVQTKPLQLLALDGITNPQNLGMIIRSVAASQFDGLILPQKGTAKLSPLVVKASAGTVFKAPLLTCDDLAKSLKMAKNYGANIAVLDSHATTDLFSFKSQCPNFIVYVLGNETDGVSHVVSNLADTRLSIAMNNNVESLNVAVTAGIIAFAPLPSDD